MSPQKSHCLFQDLLSTCTKDSNVVEISRRRMLSVVDISKKRKDSLLNFISDTANSTSNATHKNCLSTYTSNTHIDRYLKRNVSPSTNLSVKIARRSNIQ